MKNLLILLFVMLSKVCFGQVYRTEADIAKLVYDAEHYVPFHEYDTINDITIIEDASHEKLKIFGKWDYVDREKQDIDILVSHCPMLINEDNVILEFAKWDTIQDTFIKGSYLTNLIKSYNGVIKYYKKSKTEILFSKLNNKENYFIFKIKYISKINKKQSFFVYTFHGVKNKYIYSFAISHFKDEDYLNLDQFLINLYNSN